MWINSTSGGNEGVATDGANVYFSNVLNDSVSMVPVGGGTVTVLAGAQQRAEHILVDGTNVYWSTVNNGSVVSLAKGTSGTPTALAAAYLPRGVVFDGPPEKQPWGSFAKFRDPDGNQFVLSSR